MNTPQDWSINLTTFDKNDALWGRTISHQIRVGSNSYYYDNLPSKLQVGMLKSDGTIEIHKLENAFLNKAQEVIDGIVRMRPVLQLDIFKLITGESQKYLQWTVYRVIQFALNNSYQEQTVGSSISTSQITISDNLSNFFSVASTQGSAAQQSLMLSNIHKYVSDGKGGLSYDGESFNPTFKSGELLVQTEINTENDNSLATRNFVKKYEVKGEKGDIGPVGPVGTPGLPGAKGDQGLMGNQGPPGQTGHIGPVGPVGPKGSASEHVIHQENTTTSTKYYKISNYKWGGLFEAKILYTYPNAVVEGVRYAGAQYEFSSHNHAKTWNQLLYLVEARGEHPSFQPLSYLDFIESNVFKNSLNPKDDGLYIKILPSFEVRISSPTASNLGFNSISESTFNNLYSSHIFLPTNTKWISDRNIYPSTITGNKIRDDSITGNKIKDDSITGNKIKDDSITGNKIRDDSISEAKISDDAITTAKIKDDSITEAKIRDDSIIGDKIKDDSISKAKISDDAITTAKIKDDSISEAKISDDLAHELRLYKNIQSQEILLIAEYKNKAWNVIERAPEFNKIVYQINPTLAVLILDFHKPLPKGEYFMKFRGKSAKDYQFNLINQDSKNVEVVGGYQYYYMAGHHLNKNFAVNIKSYGDRKPYFLRASSRDYTTSDLRSNITMINNGDMWDISSYSKDHGIDNDRRIYDLQSNIYHISKENIMTISSPHLKFEITNYGRKKEPKFKDDTFIIFGRTVSE